MTDYQVIGRGLVLSETSIRYDCKTRACRYRIRQPPAMAVAHPRLKLATGSDSRRILVGERRAATRSNHFEPVGVQLVLHDFF
jgi:hypothetical protein